MEAEVAGELRQLSLECVVLPAVDALTPVANDGLVAGYRLACLVAAGICGGLALGCLALPRSRAAVAEPTPAAAAEPHPEPSPLPVA